MNPSPSETAFIISITVTLSVSVMTIAYMHKSMQRILIELCGSAERTYFWCAFAHVVFALVPVILLLWAHGTGHQTQSILGQVIDQLRWALFGLFFAVLCVAVTIASSVSRFEHRAGLNQPDDLRRLVTKVEGMRAGDLQERPGTT